MSTGVGFRPTELGFEYGVDGETLRVDFVHPEIARVRRFAGTRAPASALVRYGFIRESVCPAEVSSYEGEGGAGMRSKAMSVQVRETGGALQFTDVVTGATLVEHEASVAGPEPGARVRFDLPAEWRFFGLGDQTRERIEHRGTRGDLWGRNVKSYIPIPLVFTNGGFGVLLNTTRRVCHDLGASSDEWFGFDVPGGTLDYYVMGGACLADLMARYTDLTGRPPLPPRWALGLWFICRTQADAREFMDDCRSFRAHGIPCDAIGLEPGWMARNYDFSTNKDWHPERFPVPSYAKTGPHTFFATAQRMGFKPGLWLCNDYDLSHEAERRVRQAESARGQGAEGGGAGELASGHEQDEHLAGTKRLDAVTKPDEAWFEHLEPFVDQGAHWFKQDGANQVLAHPDRLWGNGMRDDEMHNLYPLLYSEQMTRGFREHTGRRPFGFTVSGWVGLQHHTATWTGDTGGGEGPVVACLNTSLSGHGMNTCDMDVTSREGIHFGFLLPWAQLNSWNYWRHPWYQGKELEEVFREYARLRYSLLPYLYSCAWESSRTGIPLLRAMPVDYADDPVTHGLTRQYMLGPSLLVGAYTSRVYLPRGLWYDFWNGVQIEGGGWYEPILPEDRGGPLLVRAGSILPFGPEVDYVGQRADEELRLEVYAGANGEFVLYEDDGVSCEYEHGAFHTTRVVGNSGDDGVEVRVLPAEGTCAAVPVARELVVVVHGLGPASDVAVNGERVAEGGHERTPYWEWFPDMQVAVIGLGICRADSGVVVGVSTR